MHIKVQWLAWVAEGGSPFHLGVLRSISANHRVEGEVNGRLRVGVSFLSKGAALATYSGTCHTA